MRILGEMAEFLRKNRIFEGKIGILKENKKFLRKVRIFEEMAKFLRKRWNF
jgi:hypothetical protein